MDSTSLTFTRVRKNLITNYALLTNILKDKDIVLLSQASSKYTIKGKKYNHFTNLAANIPSDQAPVRNVSFAVRADKIMNTATTTNQTHI